MNVRKRFMALLMAACMALSCCSVALADYNGESERGNDYSGVLADGWNVPSLSFTILRCSLYFFPGGVQSYLDTLYDTTLTAAERVATARTMRKLYGKADISSDYTNNMIDSGYGYETHRWYDTNALEYAEWSLVSNNQLTTYFSNSYGADYNENLHGFATWAEVRDAYVATGGATASEIGNTVPQVIGSYTGNIEDFFTDYDATTGKRVDNAKFDALVYYLGNVANYNTGEAVLMESEHFRNGTFPGMSVVGEWKLIIEPVMLGNAGSGARYSLSLRDMLAQDMDRGITGWSSSRRDSWVHTMGTANSNMAFGLHTSRDELSTIYNTPDGSRITANPVLIKSGKSKAEYGGNIEFNK